MKYKSNSIEFDDMQQVKSSESKNELFNTFPFIKSEYIPVYGAIIVNSPVNACAENKSTHRKYLLLKAWRRKYSPELHELISPLMNEAADNEHSSIKLMNEAADNEHSSIKPTGELKIQLVSAVPKDDRNNSDACCTAAKCHCEIQIDYLNHKVAALQRQLHVVLSNVEITKQPDSATDEDGRFMLATCARDRDKKSDNIANAANSLLSNKPPFSYSAVTEHQEVSQPGQRRQTTLKESTVTAVYVNQSINQSINQKQPSLNCRRYRFTTATSDKSLFTNLCEIELGSKPSIVLTKV